MELAEDLKRSYHQVPEAKYCSRSILPQVLSNTAVQKTKKMQEKKIRGGRQNLKDHWPLA